MRMLYYDGVKKTFFLPHILKKSDGSIGFAIALISINKELQNPN